VTSGREAAGVFLRDIIPPAAGGWRGDAGAVACLLSGTSRCCVLASYIAYHFAVLLYSCTCVFPARAFGTPCAADRALTHWVCSLRGRVRLHLPPVAARVPYPPWMVVLRVRLVVAHTFMLPARFTHSRVLACCCRLLYPSSLFCRVCGLSLRGAGSPASPLPLPLAAARHVLLAFYSPRRTALHPFCTGDERRFFASDAEDAPPRRLPATTSFAAKTARLTAQDAAA